MPTLVYIEDPFNHCKLERKLSATSERTTNLSEAEIAVSFGGDGVLLSLFRKLAAINRHNEVLLAGVNKGTLGFMANEVKEVAVFMQNVAVVYAGHFIHKTPNACVQQRYLLDADYVTKNKALNEVTFHPEKLGKLFTCCVDVSIPSLGIVKETLVYKGDGLIISTASGSTAYNLSAGGPIITPAGKNIVIIPICPFSLADRPIVLPKDAELEVRVEDSAFQMVIDGQADTYQRTPRAPVKISLSQDTLALYKTDNFLKTIQTKLGWNNSIK